MGSKELGAAFTAAFSPDAASIYVASERRVRRLDLTSLPDGRLRTREAWAAKLSHASHLTPEASGRFLVVTDTTGKHRGLDTRDGGILWETEEQGEGDRGLVLGDGSFLFIDWSGGVRRLDPETGQEVRARFEFGGKVRNLQHFGTAGMLALVQLGTAADPGSPAANRFCAYDPETHGIEVLLRDCASQDQAASPDGKLVAAVETVRALDVKPADRPRRLTVRELSTGTVLHERCFQGPQRPRGMPSWAPDSRTLICASPSGYHVLDAGDLNSIDLVPSRYGYEAVLSPDGSLVFLCDWKRPQLLRREDIGCV